MSKAPSSFISLGLMLSGLAFGQGTYVGTLHLRSSDSLYVSAEGGGGQFLVASRQVPLGWENFKVFNQTRSSGLQSGDYVALQVSNGNYVSASLGGTSNQSEYFNCAYTDYNCIIQNNTNAGLVVANRTQVGGWETFLVRKFAGTAGAAIQNGDGLTLTSAAGYYVSSQQGDAYPLLFANRTSVSGWEKFFANWGTVPSIASGGNYSVSISTPSDHDLAVASNSTSYRSSYGKLYVNETGWGTTSASDKSMIATLWPAAPILEIGANVASAGNSWMQDNILAYWANGALITLVDCFNPDGSVCIGQNTSTSTAVSFIQSWRSGLKGATSYVAAIYSPNDGKTWQTPFSDPSFNGLRAAAQASGAIATDTPPQFYLQQPAGYRQWCADEISWAMSNGIIVVAILYPDQSTNFWSDTQATVADLASRGAIPSLWAINGYYGTDVSPIHPIGSENVTNDSMYSALQLLKSYPF